MKKFSKITISVALAAIFACGFTKSPKQQTLSGADATDTIPDSLLALHLYTEGLKQKLVDEDDYAASMLFLRSLEADSTYAPALYELSEAMFYIAPDRSVEYARQAAASDTLNKWYKRRLGQAMLIARRYSEAIPVYEDLVRTDRDPDNYRMLALLYEQNERPFSAIAILDSADGQFGMIPPLTEHKRRLLLATRQYDRALDEARRAVDAMPYDADNYVAMAEVYERRGEDSMAHATFRKAVSVDSASLYAWASLGDYYLRKKDNHANLEVAQHMFTLDEMPVEDKIDLFRRLTADRRFYGEYYPQLNRLAATLSIKYPDDKRVITLYADHLISSGMIEQALDLYKSHIDDEPAELDYFTVIASIETYLEHPDSAQHYLNLALKRFPDSAEVHIRRGGLSLVEKNYDSALECFNAALECAGNDSLRSAVWGYIGDTYHARGNMKRSDMKRCYAAYDKALKANADNASVLNNYAYFLSLEGRSLDRALEMSTRACRLEENNPTFIDTRAWVLYRLKRYDEAKRLMMQALSLDSTNSPELRLHYGDILAALGDNYMAEIYWRRALEFGYTDVQAIEERIQRLNNTKK